VATAVDDVCLAQARRRQLRRATLKFEGSDSLASILWLQGVLVAGLMPMVTLTATAPILRRDLGFSADKLGYIVAGYFLVAATASRVMGPLSSRLGTVISLRLAVGTDAIAMVAMASRADAWWHLAFGLGVAGACQALIEPSANQFVVSAVARSRLGMAMGIKQTAAPAALLFAGVGAAAIAAPIGWRWQFALAALVGVLIAAAPQRSAGVAPAARENVLNVVRFRGLAWITIAVLLAGAAGAAGQAFIVDSATTAGLSPAVAGGLFAASGLVGVGTRLLSGVRADQSQQDLNSMALLLLAGAAIFLVLATSRPLAFWLTMPFVLSTTAGWPGLVHLAIVRRHPGSAASATAIVMSGMFLGSVMGPLAFAQAVNRLGYSAAWISAASCAVAAAVVVSMDRFERRRGWHAARRG
jgi:predicted MFS family arabinose efflux permease